MDRNEVSTAFEIVLEEVESVVDNLNENGDGILWCRKDI